MVARQKPFSMCRLIHWILSVAGIALIFASCTRAVTNSGSLTFTTDRDSVLMGRTVMVTAHLEAQSSSLPHDYVILPFVNQRRWGSHERPDSNGNATFILPLPNPGMSEIELVAVKAEPGNWMGISNRKLLLAGNPIPDSGIHSSVSIVQVKRRVLPPVDSTGHLFCVQWEPWFIPGPGVWSTAEAVPLVGFYDSYNEDVIRQHILWFIDAGVHFIMPDWSNHIWAKKHWDEIEPGSRAIVHATTVFLEVLAKMRDEGLPVPKVALMPGVSNGPPATMVALNEQLEWIYQNYILNPRFKGLFQEYDGKSLMLILDTGAIGDKRGTAASAFTVPFFKQTLALSESALDAFRRAQGPVDDSHFTIRWVSSQNQITQHHELGYWSWMDGQLEPMVTYNKGRAEAITVTNAFFEPLGWTAPKTYGKRNGTTYIESFKYALRARPDVIFLHQFNEFAGQAEGGGLGPNHDIYLDEHSMEFSDDFEPVSQTASGYRDASGGWGFYYLNLTRALIDLYNGKDNQSTILAARIAESSDKEIKVEWSVTGVLPADYKIEMDGKTLQAEVKDHQYLIPVKGLSKGKHSITLTANGSHTYYALSRTEFDVLPAEPMAVVVTLDFEL